MKRFSVKLISLIAGVLACIWLPVQAVEQTQLNQTNPYALVQQVADKTFARFAQDKSLIEADLGHLKVIVAEELIPHVDYKYAAYKVMGQYLRETSPQQRADFVEAFKGYMIATYAQALTEYTDQTVEYAPAMDFTGEKIVDVNVQIVEQGRPPIKIQFKARRLKDNTWKAFDMVAEGVSLLASKQAEISNLIRKQGIDEVIVLLRSKTDQTIDPEPQKDS
ncbi:phospholipid-binding protein MlaC [Shewanella maritima]|uniref:MlaC/ttg2D family ABC transporter substrate-binding protein n=1 Tax=Shewanella maritima TaxID=2520507 RepID=UPI003736009C